MVQKWPLRILGSKLHPRIFQLLCLVLLGAIFSALLTGGRTSENNFGIIALWYVWWPLIPLSFIFLGRFWCAVCPMPLISLWTGKIFKTKSIHGKFLDTYGAWGLLFSVVILHTVNLIIYFEENIAASFWLLTFVVAGVAATSILTKKLSWCWFLCPVSALARALSINSMVGLSRDSTRCSDKCKENADGECRYDYSCFAPEPLREKMSRNACNFCGECIKICNYGSIKFDLQLPLLKNKENAEFFWADTILVLTVLGIALSMGLQHMRDWPVMMWELSEKFSTPVTATAEIGLLTLITFLPMVFFFAAARLSAKGKPGEWKRAMPRSAKSVSPMALAVIIAVNMRIVLIDGPLAIKNYLFNYGLRLSWINSVVWLDGFPVQAVSCFVIVLGSLAAVYALNRSSSKELGYAQLPYQIFIAVCSALFLWISSHPLTP